MSLPSKIRVVISNELAALGRLDVVLPAAFPGLSRRAWRGALDAGVLRRNGDVTRVQGRSVCAGDVLEVHVGKLLENLNRHSGTKPDALNTAISIEDDADDAAILAAMGSSSFRGGSSHTTLPFEIPIVCIRPPPLDVLTIDSRLLVVNKQAGTLCQGANHAAPSAAELVPADDAFDADSGFNKRNHAEDSLNMDTQVMKVQSSPSKLAIKGLNYGSMPLDALVAWWLAHQATSASRAGGSLGGFLHMYHRIDRSASGAVLFVRNRALLSHLDAAWDTGIVERRYIAVVQGVPSWTSRVAREPIGRLGGVGNGTWKFGVSPSGRPARTELRVLAVGRGFSVIEAKPTTGRTHQIRVHLSSAGHPIIGDELYGADTQRWPVMHPSITRNEGNVITTGLNVTDRDTYSDSNSDSDSDSRKLSHGNGVKITPGRNNFRRILLHSHRIAFHEPVRHARLDAVAPLPRDVESWVTAASTILGHV